MSEPNLTWPTPAETTDILRFLHRFADLMSNGSNSNNLLRAAKLLEAHVHRLKQTDELLQAERTKGEAGTEACRMLETKAGALEQDILALKSQLAEQQSRSETVVAEMERRLGEFLARAEEAEAGLAAVRAAPPAIAPGSIAVPLSLLQVAKAQFESLALTFQKSGNIVPQVMCEASASCLDRVILDADIAADDTDDRSQHAA